MCLVKGSTRRIVEINQPDSHYFEKAVFYCRTNIPRSTDESTLTQEAERIIRTLCADTQISAAPPKRSRLRGFLKAAAAAAAGALGAFLLFRFHL